MDVNFCKYFRGDGQLAPGNQYCRTCENGSIACNKLWELVRDLAGSNNGDPLQLKNSQLKISLYRKNRNHTNVNLIYLRKKAIWPLPKEVFLYFVSTEQTQWGFSDDRDDPQKSPNLTKYANELYSIVEMLGGWNIPEIIAVKNVQK